MRSRLVGGRAQAQTSPLTKAGEGSGAAPATVAQLRIATSTVVGNSMVGFSPAIIFAWFWPQVQSCWSESSSGETGFFW